MYVLYLDICPSVDDVSVQVVITTYQTLCQDFLIPGGVEADEEEVRAVLVILHCKADGVLCRNGCERMGLWPSSFSQLETTLTCF